MVLAEILGSVLVFSVIGAAFFAAYKGRVDWNHWFLLVSPILALVVAWLWSLSRQQ